ncbi:MAG: hypothetical protein ACJ72W_14025 [Actinoallomurus sp.]
MRGVRMPILRAAGTEAHTTWVFTTDLASAGTKPLVLPLLNLGYQVGLDAMNNAKPGKPLPIRLDAYRPAGAAPSKVTSLQAFWSTDGGAHWQSLQANRTGDGRYNAVLPAAALAKSGTLSLHVTAKDAGGSTVDQVLPTAFHVAS